MSRSPDESRFHAALAFLARPRAHFFVAALAFVLLLPAVGGRLVLDDHVLAVKARADRDIDGLPTEPPWLFTFTTGDAQRNQTLIDEGVLLPWWTDPTHKNAFFRPLSSLSHLLDFALWPGTPQLMYLHSIALYVALLLALAHVYRTVGAGSSFLAGLALLVYALDDAHGATVGWIANRNAVLATLLALPALSAHHRYRLQGFQAGRWLAPACFAAGLLAGEASIAVFGYLLAHALLLDEGPLRPRLTSLWPFVLLLVLHRVAYLVFDLGSRGSSAYRDPASEPFEFLLSLAYNLPVLISAQLGAPLADFAFWGDPALRAPLFVFSCASVLVLAWVLWPVLRRDAQARFWAFGMLLSAVPVSASLPGERLLLVVGVGAAPVLARCFDMAFSAAAEWRAPVRRGLSALLVLAHLVFAPLGLPLRAHALQVLGRALDRADESLPAHAAIEDQTVVVVNAPFNVMVSYIQAARESRGVPRPRSLLWLASMSSEMQLERSDERTLRVRLEGGFLRRPEETHYRSSVRDLRAGTELALREMSVRIVDLTADGRPRTVDFAFMEPLHSARYHLVQYRDGRFRPFLPPIGHTERLPAQDFFDVLASEASR